MNSSNITRALRNDNACRRSFVRVFSLDQMVRNFSCLEDGDDRMYLIMPANASHNRFPNNKNHNYKIPLPQRLRLNGGLREITLRSISFNNNWYCANAAKDSFIDIRTEVVIVVLIGDASQSRRFWKKFIKSSSP